jgi:hypothetical protein
MMTAVHMICQAGHILVQFELPGRRHYFLRRWLQSIRFPLRLLVVHMDFGFQALETGWGWGLLIRVPNLL